ncbi:H-NS family nucleoid-associated regulatory protein [Delftia sp. UME58]|uniref:H-NS histone family protein n=1 Tax=Delftia sp. UME58 TaxID=1862322 RepID=UPI00160099C6|nr:H-NS histone family protein [Delftia sp. UME58]MBB1651643.1 histone [Delftia sp. UME58]
MSEYKTLLAQRAELDAQIAQAQAEAKAQAVAQARALIAEHGLTAADVFPQGKSKGSVGAPKYRDPATGVTWTGRGKPPNWINGKDRESFLIIS